MALNSRVFLIMNGVSADLPQLAYSSAPHATDLQSLSSVLHWTQCRKENPMNINKGNVAWLCFAWAALILLGLVVGLNVPFLLAVIGTVLYLIL